MSSDRLLSNLERGIETGDYSKIIPHMTLYRRLKGLAPANSKKLVFDTRSIHVSVLKDDYVIKVAFKGLYAFTIIVRRDDNKGYVHNRATGMQDMQYFCLVRGKLHKKKLCAACNSYAKGVLDFALKAATIAFCQRIEASILDTMDMSAIARRDKEYFRSIGIEPGKEALADFKEKITAIAEGWDDFKKSMYNSISIRDGFEKLAEEIASKIGKKNIISHDEHLTLKSSKKDFFTYKVSFSYHRRSFEGTFCLKTGRLVEGKDSPAAPLIEAAIKEKLSGGLETAGLIMSEKAMTRILSFQENLDRHCRTYINGLRCLEKINPDNLELI